MIVRGTCRIESVEGFKEVFPINLMDLKNTLTKIKKTHTGPTPKRWTKPLLVLKIRHIVDNTIDIESISTITITSEKGFL